MGKYCFYCGIEFEEESFVIDHKDFCYNGCKTVYEILNQHYLGSHYGIEKISDFLPHNLLGNLII